MSNVNVEDRFRECKFCKTHEIKFGVCPVCKNKGYTIRESRVKEVYTQDSTLGITMRSR